MQGINLPKKVTEKFALFLREECGITLSDKRIISTGLGVRILHNYVRSVNQVFPKKYNLLPTALLNLCTKSDLDTFGGSGAESELKNHALTPGSLFNYFCEDGYKRTPQDIEEVKKLSEYYLEKGRPKLLKRKKRELAPLDDHPIQLAMSEYDDENKEKVFNRLTQETASKLLALKPGKQVDPHLREVILPEDHKPSSLAGQKGVKTSRKFKKGETLAVYEGVYSRKRREHNGYTVNVISDYALPDDPMWSGKGEYYEHILYIVDPLDSNSGNLSMFINDYRDDIKEEKNNDPNKINCKFLTVMETLGEYEVWPRLLVVATKDLEENQDVLVDYYWSYWEGKAFQ
jgi:hypothetical protein